MLGPPVSLAHQPPRQTGRLLACMALALFLGLPALAGARPGSADDFFVVLVYARNLLEGHGFVHQIGGPAVDGFTSPLDLAWKTAALALAPRDGVLAAWASTSLAYLGALLTAGWAAARCTSSVEPGLRWPLGLLTAAALALCPGLAEGTAYLLEAPLVGMLWIGLLGLMAGAPRDGWRLPLGLCVLLLLARPEGLVLGSLTLVFLTSKEQRGRSLLIWAGVVAAFILARLALFGTLAPNAYYAKASDSRLNELVDGVRYVRLFLASSMGLAVFGCWLLGLAAAARGKARLGPSVCATAALAVVIVSGGDGYLGTRLLLPFTLAAILSAAAALSESSGLLRTLLLVGLASFPALLAETLPFNLYSTGLSPSAMALRGSHFPGERRLAERLAQVQPPQTLGHLHLQSAAWFAPGLAVLDLSGLNDPKIAHLPAPGPVAFGREALEYGLEQGVTVLHLSPGRTDPMQLAGLDLNQILADPQQARTFFGNLQLPPERVALLST
ncbi:MAG: hypothetical protein ACI8QC_004130, partial [Planctomycetota bacterium]